MFSRKKVYLVLCLTSYFFLLFYVIIIYYFSFFAALWQHNFSANCCTLFYKIGHGMAFMRGRAETTSQRANVHTCVGTLFGSKGWQFSFLGIHLTHKETQDCYFATTWDILQRFPDKITQQHSFHFAVVHSWFCLHSWSISCSRRLIYSEKNWLFCFCQNGKCVEIWRRVFCPVPQLLMHIQTRVLCGWPRLSPFSQSWHFNR